MNWYLEVLKKYAVFDGRARRTEYWMFTLFHLLIMLALSFVEGALGLSATGGFGGGFLSLLYGLAMMIPGLAVVVRRLHDTGRSGWWFFIGFIPLIGPIVLVVFLCLDSQPGRNQYGENPKEVSY